ncbi:MAG TPA: DUF2127 domain-containing protein, partial [Acidimicrobiales bacterium]|nr:DUF2127 domain-containing protein [Acidimicrobiales bacterium]
YELIGCGLHGHELVGTDAAELREEDHLFAREADGLRWYRCLRCDSWLPLPPPASSPNRFPPARAEVKLPLRGKPLRDRFVLRLIAFDRIVHFVVLGALAVAIFLFANNRQHLKGEYTKILNAIQGAVGGPLFDTKHNSIFNEVNKLFALPTHKLLLYGAVIGAYAAINFIEAFGLWGAKRWAEYLTLIEVTVLVPLEVYELTIRLTTLKTITLVINIAVVVYLLYSHRLLGIRGGGKAAREEIEHDTGWQALERATPAGSPAG